MDIQEAYKENLKSLGELGEQVNNVIEENRLLKKEVSNLQEIVTNLRITLSNKSPKEPFETTEDTWEIIGDDDEKA